MNIEVTQATFNTLFKQVDFVNKEEGELANKFYFYREDLDQKGITINNYTSGVIQYYLTDINA